MAAGLRLAVVIATCLVVRPVAAQQPGAAARLLESPECGPARPGCTLPPGVRRQVLRQARLEALRDASGGVPAGAASSAHATRMPLPTPEDQIQPAYRDHGTVRPEYRDSGSALR